MNYFVIIINDHNPSSGKSVRNNYLKLYMHVWPMKKKYKSGFFFFQCRPTEKHKFFSLNHLFIFHWVGAYDWGDIFHLNPKLINDSSITNNK